MTLETRITSEIGWNWLDSGTSTSTRTQGTFQRQLAFSALGTPGVDAIWYLENASIPALTTVTHDLNALNQSIYGTDIPVNFANLCTIYIFNRSATLPLSIVNTGTAQSVVTTSYLNLLVPPGGFFMLCNPTTSWSITTSRNQLQIQNPGSQAVAYDIFLSGKKAS